MNSIRFLNGIERMSRRMLTLVNLFRTNIAFLSGETTSKGIITVADQTVASITNFLTGVIVARACTKQEFGLYTLGFSIILFILAVQQSLISSPYTLYNTRLQSRKHALYTGSTLIHQLILSAIASCSLALFGLFLSFGLGPVNLISMVKVLVLVITPILIKEYIRQVSFAQLRMVIAFLVDLFVAVLQISGLIILVHVGLISASVVFYLFGVSCGLAALFWFISMWEGFKFRFCQVISDSKRNFRLGKWIFADNLSRTASYQLYPWLLAGFHGAVATGVLNACFGVVLLSNPFLIGMHNLLGPKTSYAYACGGIVELRRVVYKFTVIVTAVITPFCIVMLLFGDKLVVLLYGNKYAGHGITVSLLVLAILASSLTDVFGYGLWAIERPDVNFKVNLISLGIVFTFGLALVKSFGPSGAACGFLVGSLAASTYRYIAFSNQYRFHSEQEVIDSTF